MIQDKRKELFERQQALGPSRDHLEEMARFEDHDRFHHEMRHSRHFGDHRGFREDRNRHAMMREREDFPRNRPDHERVSAERNCDSQLFYGADNEEDCTVSVTEEQREAQEARAKYDAEQKAIFEAKEAKKKQVQDALDFLSRLQSRNSGELKEAEIKQKEIEIDEENRLTVKISSMELIDIPPYLIISGVKNRQNYKIFATDKGHISINPKSNFPLTPRKGHTELQASPTCRLFQLIYPTLLLCYQSKLSISWCD
jgi:hypothetical protein